MLAYCFGAFFRRHEKTLLGHRTVRAREIGRPRRLQGATDYAMLVRKESPMTKLIKLTSSPFTPNMQVVGDAEI
jgi:hypothetical protein